MQDGRPTPPGARPALPSPNQGTARTDLAGASAVQLAPADPGRGRHPSCCIAASDPGRHQALDLGPGRRPRRRPRAAPATGAPPPRADDQGELAPGRDRATSAPARPARPASRGRSTRGAWSARGRPRPARSPPQAAARSASVAATRPGASYSDRRPLVGGDPGQALPALAAGARQEALERPARPGDPARHDRRQHGRGAGDRHDGAALGGPGPDEVLARVADAGRAGVGDQGQVGAARAGARASSGSRPAALRAWKLTRWVVIA